MAEEQARWVVIGEQGPELVSLKGKRLYDPKTGKEIHPEEDDE